MAGTAPTTPPLARCCSVAREGPLAERIPYAEGGQRMMTPTPQQCSTARAQRHGTRSDQTSPARRRRRPGAGRGGRLGVMLCLLLTLGALRPTAAHPPLATTPPGGLTSPAPSTPAVVPGGLSSTLDGPPSGGPSRPGQPPGPGDAADVQAIADFLQHCESGGNPHAVNWQDARITGHPSKGLFQFQRATFQHYARKYGLIPPGRAITPYYDSPVYQRQVAEAMIAHGETGHWKICFGKYARARGYSGDHATQGRGE
jgi:hypothetical protein